MDEFLAKCQPLEVIVVIAITGVTAVLTAAIRSRRLVRLAQIQTAFKQHLLQSGVSVDEVVRLTADSDVDRSVFVNVATSLASLQQVTPEEIEEYMELVKLVDPATQQAISRALDGLFEQKPSKELVLATIRGLCK
jgi:hypothetical protein